MKCRKCDYPLWNLTEPRCPECGEGFDVMSYWFTPGSVVFKCPFCDHRHVGRDGRGMPFDAGRCEGCGQMLVVEQMPVEPVDGAVELEVTTDDDYSLTRRKRSAAQRRASIAVLIAIGAFVAWVLILFAMRQP